MFTHAAFVWADSGATEGVKVYEGENLSEPLEVELDFSESDYVLVTASQRHADYILKLQDQHNNSTVKRVNINYSSYLDEWLLVHKSDCHKCLVRIEGLSNLDTQSPYRLSMRPTFEQAPKRIELLKAITAAGALWSQAIGAGDEEIADKKLNQAISQLQSVISDTMVAQYEQAYLQALSLIAKAHSGTRQFDEHDQVVERILLETQSKPSKYRLNALYDFAQATQNVTAIIKRYDSLISEAQALEEPVYVAMGQMGKAVTLVNEARFVEAIEILELAQISFESLQIERELPVALYNLSWAHQRAGNFPESLRYATQQRLMSEAKNDHENILWALYNLAMTYGQMGDTAIADSFSDRAISLIENLPNDVSFNKDTITAALTFQMAQIGLRFGTLDLANDYLAESKRAYDAVGNKAMQAGLTFVAGEISMARGDYAAARESFLKAIAANRENDRVLLSGAFMLRLAELEMTHNDPVSAAPHQAQALKILAKTEDYYGLARALSQAVELLYRLGALQDAAELAAKVGLFVDKHSLQHDKAKFAYRRALVAVDLDLLDESETYLASATSIIESTLPKVRRRDLRQTYLALQKSIFELNIETALERNSDNVLLPLLAAEQFKARTLKESINSIDDQLGINPDVVSKRKELLKNIQAKAMAWHQGRAGGETPASVLEQTRVLSLALQKLEAEIEYSRKQDRTGQTKLDITDIPLPFANEVVAYYFTGERQSWLWVLTVKEKAVYRLPPIAKLEPLVANFLDQVSQPPVTRVGSSIWSQRESIAQLSEVLLQSLADHIEPGITDTITFIADGLLHAVPMAPLVLPGSDEPLISDFALAQSPSLMIKQSLRKRAIERKRNRQLSALVIADPINLESSELGLARLQHTIDEARYIESYMGDATTSLVSENALKAKFFEHYKKPYSILHFATHGLLNNHEPALSGLVFSDVDGGESLWLAPEIRQTNIQANLVVLSACESSIGKNISGEGLFSLSRAFIEAGASQVVGTLWKVQDRATAGLVNQFYMHLTSGQFTVAQALRKAQMAIYQDKENDWSDPYYWAGFQLQGGGSNQSYASSN